MRISDWSSDVCSSDLSGRAEPSRIGWISVADGAMLAALATSGENISTALIRTNRGMRDMDYSSQRTTSDRLPLCRSARQGAQRGLGMKAGPGQPEQADRRHSSEERRVGTEGGSACRSGGSPYHKKKNIHNKNNE